jgi:ATP-dependent DNA helicase PIF1
MGGIQVIFCGDFFQLPPIINKNSSFHYISKKLSNAEFSNTSTQYNQINYDEKYSILNNTQSNIQQNYNKNLKYCFQSKIWDILIQETYELTTVFRQQGDNEFIKYLNQIRHGLLTNETERFFQKCISRKLDCSDGILPTQIFTHKLYLMFTYHLMSMLNLNF